MTRTVTGLDVLLSADYPLPYQRLGLLTHPAAVTVDARHSADALLAAGANLAAVFGPEHGFRGTAQAGASEQATTDPRTNLPVYDTYGTDVEALTGMLERSGVDTLVVDLQHVGSRFFTYESSLYDAIDAAGRIGVEVIVLDRPNPLGGTVVQGPVLDPAFSSFVGRAPIPLRHGMTMGELAGLFAELTVSTRPQVVAMEGWDPASLFADTGLPWVPPSPNLPTAISALCYPGICLLEGTNLSVGRGTTTPFEICGAPWIDGSLAETLRSRDLPGVLIREAYATPVVDVHAGETMCGVQLHVTDTQSFDPVDTALAILAIVQERWPDRLEFRPFFDLLAGTDRLRHAITSGTVNASGTAATSFDDEIRAFTENVREPHLIYPRGEDSRRAAATWK